MNYDSLQSVTLSLANERSLDGVLNTIVESLCDQDHVALARIWLLEQGPPCDDEPEVGDTLRLVASDGHSLEPSAERWRTRDPAGPLEYRKVDPAEGKERTG